MYDAYNITVVKDADGLWHAYRRMTTGPQGTVPLLAATGVTVRDAMDELALAIERERREHDNAPHET